MSRVNVENFLSWIHSRFPDAVDNSEKNNRVLLNSIYCDDTKHHIWCDLERHLFKCFKTGKGGNFYELVMDVDKCSYHEAVDKLGEGKPDLCYWNSKMYEFLENKITKNNKSLIKQLQLPDGTFLINSLKKDDIFRIKSEKYLEGRGIKPDKLMVCVGGDYVNRIVIPYYIDDELVFYNARDLGNSPLRYKGPELGNGMSKDKVLYFPQKYPSGSKVFLVEGEFDALTLVSCGFNAVAGGGKEISKHQLDLLKNYEIALSTDNDESGKIALFKIAKAILSLSKNVTCVRVPNPFKDWNEMYVKDGKLKVIEYINKYEMKITQKEIQEIQTDNIPWSISGIDPRHTSIPQDGTRFIQFKNLKLN